MSTLRAVVFTRPYPIGIGDYTFFVRPVEFVKDRRFFDAHIRNVLHEDDSGAIGGIKGRRWHVLRRGDLVIVGMATNEFGRRDESGRAIRGYYGFAMPANDIKLPSETLFKELDKVCVEPAFMQAPVRTKDSDRLSGELFDDPAQYKVALDSHKWNFNTNPSRISFHCCDEVGDILSSALAAASHNAEFEIVIGLNTEEHAKRLPILNCVCHAVSAAKEIQFPERTTITDNITEQKPDSVKETKNCGQGRKEPFIRDSSPDNGNIIDSLITVSTRRPSTGKKILQKIFGLPREQKRAQISLESTVHSNGGEAARTKVARRIFEQGFDRNESSGQSRTGEIASPLPTQACDDSHNHISPMTGNNHENIPETTSQKYRWAAAIGGVVLLILIVAAIGTCSRGSRQDAAKTPTGKTGDGTNAASIRPVTVRPIYSIGTNAPAQKVAVTNAPPSSQKGLDGSVTPATTNTPPQGAAVTDKFNSTPVSNKTEKSGS